MSVVDGTGAIHHGVNSGLWELKGMKAIHRGLIELDLYKHGCLTSHIMHSSQAHVFEQFVYFCCFSWFQNQEKILHLGLPTQKLFQNIGTIIGTVLVRIISANIIINNKI